MEGYVLIIRGGVNNKTNSDIPIAVSYIDN